MPSKPFCREAVDLPCAHGDPIGKAVASAALHAAVVHDLDGARVKAVHLGSGAADSGVHRVRQLLVASRDVLATHSGQDSVGDLHIRQNGTSEGEISTGPMPSYIRAPEAMMRTVERPARCCTL